MIFNEYEQHVVDCLKNSEIYGIIKAIFINDDVAEDNEFVTSQIGFDDNCRRLFFFGDKHLFVYGGDERTFKNDKRVMKQERKMGHPLPPFTFEYAPCCYLDYSDREHLYLPLTSFCAKNGRELVSLQRVVALWAETVQDIVRSNNRFMVGDLKYTTYNYQGYNFFSYNVPPLGWKSWFD